MKRLITCASRRTALNNLCNNLKSQGLDAKVNYDHNCVDIYESSDHLVPSKQAYVLENGTIESYRCRYEYVGEGKGDYIQRKYPIKEKNFTENSLYVKDVASSNISDLIHVICMCYYTGSTKFTYPIKNMLGLDENEYYSTDVIEDRLNSSYSRDVIKLYQELYAIASDPDGDIPGEILQAMGIVE